MTQLLSLEDDKLLLSQIRDDNKAAFTEIYSRYWDKIYEHAAKITRSSKDAEDIVQEVFCSLWKRRKELNITGSISAYLFTSARYISIRYIEKNITQHKYYQQLSEVMQQSITPLASNELEYKELEQKISGVITQLPPKMQEVYRMSRVEHLSHKEIAGKLNIAETTVKKQIGYALKLIRRGVAMLHLVGSIFIY
jgi:RNA polymerase sigma-70 factor (family 1)